MGSRPELPPSSVVGPRVRPLPISRRRRRPPLLGPALALGAVGAGLCALVLSRGVDVQPVAVAPAAPQEPAPLLVAPVAPPPAGLPPAPTRPALTVFNNSRIPDLGDRMAGRYRAAGWPVETVAGLRGRIRASTVYYDAGQREQAEEVARSLGVGRVLPRFDRLPGTGLTVVVTRDLV